MTGTNEYIRAFTELNCLLKYIPRKYLKKTPKKFIKLIKEKSDEQYNIKINTKKKLKDYNLSRRTEILLAILKYNYWCENEEEKDKLEQIFKNNELEYKKKMREKYNPDNIFKNTKNIKTNDESNVALVIIKKEKWYQKITTFIKGIFKRDK